MNSEKWKKIVALCIGGIDAIYLIFLLIFTMLVVAKVVVFNIYFNFFTYAVCAINFVAVVFILTYLFLHKKR
ncbi:MAG: hypothetical protein EOM55_00075 [Clostridia bacterium]|nr:hypothetical protein [Clostridia bacterium]